MSTENNLNESYVSFKKGLEELRKQVKNNIKQVKNEKRYISWGLMTGNDLELGYSTRHEKFSDDVIDVFDQKTDDFDMAFNDLFDNISNLYYYDIDPETTGKTTDQYFAGINDLLDYFAEFEGLGILDKDYQSIIDSTKTQLDNIKNEYNKAMKVTQEKTLTMDSYLVCKCGGIIKFKSTGQMDPKILIMLRQGLIKSLEASKTQLDQTNTKYDEEIVRQEGIIDDINTEIDEQNGRSSIDQDSLIESRNLVIKDINKHKESLENMKIRLNNMLQLIKTEENLLKRENEPIISRIEIKDLSRAEKEALRNEIIKNTIDVGSDFIPGGAGQIVSGVLTTIDTINFLEDLGEAGNIKENVSYVGDQSFTAIEYGDQKLSEFIKAENDTLRMDYPEFEDRYGITFVDKSPFEDTVAVLKFVDQMSGIISLAESIFDYVGYNALQNFFYKVDVTIITLTVNIVVSVILDREGNILSGPTTKNHEFFLNYDSNSYLNAKTNFDNEMMKKNLNKSFSSKLYFNDGTKYDRNYDIERLE